MNQASSPPNMTLVNGSRQLSHFKVSQAGTVAVPISVFKAFLVGQIGPLTMTLDAHNVFFDPTKSNHALMRI